MNKVQQITEKIVCVDLLDKRKRIVLLIVSYLYLLISPMLIIVPLGFIAFFSSIMFLAWLMWTGVLSYGFYIMTRLNDRCSKYN